MSTPRQGELRKLAHGILNSLTYALCAADGTEEALEKAIVTIQKACQDAHKGGTVRERLARLVAMEIRCQALDSDGAVLAIADARDRGVRNLVSEAAARNLRAMVDAGIETSIICSYAGVARDMVYRYGGRHRGNFVPHPHELDEARKSVAEIADENLPSSPLYSLLEK